MPMWKSWFCRGRRFWVSGFGRASPASGRRIGRRTSIDVNRGSPDGDGSPASYFDSSPFKPVATIEEEEEAILAAWLAKHLP